MSSDCNSFSSVCLGKNRQRLAEGGIEADNPEGIGAVFLVCFFFHPPSCAAVIASSLLLPAARERHLQNERERKGREAQ